jgi:hypothetical protein
VRLPQQRGQGLAVEDLGDEQHGVGPGEARLEELVAVEDEVLAQQRRRHRGADPGKVRQVPLEEGGVGEDADGGGAVAGVGAGDGDRVEVGADQPGGGRGALDLGDDLHAAGRFQGHPEVAHRRGLGQAPLQVGFRQAGPRLVDLPALARHNAVQDGGHRHSDLAAARFVVRA